MFTYEEEKQFNGFATLPPAGGCPCGLFFDAARCGIIPARSIYFPIAHTRALLERAEKGEKFFQRISFSAEPIGPSNAPAL